MALLYNLAKMTTATTGTGTVTLGSAVPGYLTFAEAGVTNGQVVSYAIQDGSNGEVGTGTYTSSGTTLTRTVTTSTNSNTAINLSGNAIVFISPRAADLLNPSVATPQTLAGPLILPASTTSAAPLNIPQGTAPSAPTNGDIWTTSAGLYARINGTTVGPFGGIGYSQIATNTISGATASLTYSSLSLTDILLSISAATGDSGTNISFNIELSTDNGSTWSTARAFSASNIPSATPRSGSVFLSGLDVGVASGTGAIASSSGANLFASTITLGANLGARIDAIRIFPSAGNFDAGTFTLYGR